MDLTGEFLQGFNYSLLKASPIKHCLKKLTLLLFQKCWKIRNMAILALFTEGKKSISVHVNNLNAQVSNVYDHHEHLGTLYGDSACFEPRSESVVGVHWSRIAQLRFPVTEHFTVG